MIELRGHIHDRYTLEFKLGFLKSHSRPGRTEYVMDTWMFFPDALYLNAQTYPKETFYRDLRTMTRLITPRFTLQQIANADNLPLSRLKKWCQLMAEKDTPRHRQMYEHQVKIFCCIVRSALRDYVEKLTSLRDEDKLQARVAEMVRAVSLIVSGYRGMEAECGMREMAEDMLGCYRQGDEYLCRVVGSQYFDLMNAVRRHVSAEAYDRICRPMGEYIDGEAEYQQRMGYLLPDAGNDAQNRHFIHRAGQLKKYVESDLWLLAPQRSNTFLWQQLFFMLAAGVSMVFATVVSFSFQQTFGNFTLPLFIALVISYMFKDRMKSLGQAWFANKAGSILYDYKTRIAMGDVNIGWNKTGFDYVSTSKLPDEVRRLRGRVLTLPHGSSPLRERIMLYRQHLTLDGNRLSQMSHYPLEGVNQILRINLREYLRRMDSSQVPVYIQHDGTCHTEVQAEKVYYVYYIMRIRYHGTTSYRRFRLTLTRRGAQKIEEQLYPE